MRRDFLELISGVADSRERRVMAFASGATFKGMIE